MSLHVRPSMSASAEDASAGGGQRGTPFDVRQRQDNAAGGRGKRRLIRLWVPRKGKKRQHGAIVEDDDAEPEIPGITVGDEAEAGAPEYKDIPYTHPGQESPGRKRGRRLPLGTKPKHQRDLSLWQILSMPAEELFEWCVSRGYLQDLPWKLLEAHFRQGG